MGDVCQAAFELCDGLDNNGDGVVDEGFADIDGDGVADFGVVVEPEVCDCLDTRWERVGQLLRITKAQKAVFKKLRSALDELVRAGKLSVGIVRGQFTVNMVEKILFDSGKSDLKAGAKETLAELASILRSVPERRYQVAGHTDSRGSDGFNWKFSGARARAVLKFMIAEGMAPRRISYTGYGEYQPTAPNDTSDNMALNRRIEVVLVPDLEAFLKPFAGGS